MRIEVLSDADAVARAGASVIAEAARDAVEARGRFTLALSGGRTPWVMLRALADEDVPWKDVHVFQVDERIAPADDSDRNCLHLRESLVASAPLPPENLHLMPVDDADRQAAASRYAHTLETLAGSPPMLDLIHLGLGCDGHTASLVPGDPILDVRGAWVGLTGVYQNRHRMTLTYPVLDRARRRLFIVTGAEKADALRRLSEGDQGVPAGRVRSDDALVLADEVAAHDIRCR